jgi:hypothetical protein
MCKNPRVFACDKGREETGFGEDAGCGGARFAAIAEPGWGALIEFASSPLAYFAENLRKTTPQTLKPCEQLRQC